MYKLKVNDKEQDERFETEEEGYLWGLENFAGQYLKMWGMTPAKVIGKFGIDGMCCEDFGVQWPVELHVLETYW